VPPTFLLFAIFALIGFSGGAVNTLTNPVLLETVPTKPERFLAFMHMLFSLFSIIAPIIAQMIYGFGGLEGVFLVIGGFGLGWAVFALVIFRRQMFGVSTIQKQTFKNNLVTAKNVFLKPGMNQILFLSVMISAWQLGSIYYVSSYIRSLGGTAHEGAIALSVLFGGMMLSRLLYSRIADKFRPGHVLMLTNLLGVLAWAGLIIAQGIAAKTIMMGMTAFFCANNFPIVFLSTCRIAPQNSASASGFVILGYYVATFAFVPIIGALGDALGLGNAFLFIGAPLLLVPAAAYMLQKRMTLQSYSD
jgi:fucose permease